MIAFELLITFIVVMGLMMCIGSFIGHWVGDMETGYYWGALITSFLVVVASLSLML